MDRPSSTTTTEEGTVITGITTGSGNPPGTSITKSMSVFVWQSSDITHGLKNLNKINKTIRVAIALLALAFIFIIIAFSTPAWLETDGDLERPKFIRIGKL